MHNKNYASGFLFHPPSKQILLQQYSSPPQTAAWLLFGGWYLENEKPESFLKDTFFKLLDIKIDVINHVYSYSKEQMNKSQYIGYIEVESLQDFQPKNGLTFAWFSFKDVLKLQTTEQMKHDIVVGKRVIDAATRKLQGLHTFQ